MKKPTMPETAGVYIFKNGQGTAIYIGKAKNLKSRVSSYFMKNLAPKTAAMRAEAQSISHIQVDSEFEALLLEASLVKKHQPKYNSELKDDKSPLYIGITKEIYPRIITLRQTQLSEIKLKKLYGPFLDGGSAKRVLRLIRKVVPYCTHRPGKRGCVYSQIGLCNPCSSEIVNTSSSSIKEELSAKYSKNVNKVSQILSGKLGSIKKELENEIKKFAKNEQFEDAQRAKLQLEMFVSITAPRPKPDAYLQNPNLHEDMREAELNSLAHALSYYFPKIQRLNRIECFDIAHLSGSQPTASMVTFIQGEADKTFYRHFKVSSERTNNDTDSMRKILERRAKHFEDWGVPDLLIVDGGRGQLSAALAVVPNHIVVIGLAKRLETVIIRKDKVFYELRLQGPALHLLQRLRDEAHRFARRYHHKLMKKALFDN